MAYTRCLSLPVFLGFTLVTFVYYTTVVLVINPWMGVFTANGLLNTLSFTAWYLMVLWSYSVCIFTDPGAVPPKYHPEMEEGSTAVQEVKRKGGDLRFCQKCLCYKPPRAHHCRLCKRCVLRMDHHCIWINNCVGHWNYKAFVLFVMYDVIALGHGLVLLLSHAAACLSSASSLSPSQCLLKAVPSHEPPVYTWLQPSPATVTFFEIVYVLICLPLGLSLLVLFLWHIFLVAHNKTTIEHSEGIRAKLLNPKALEPFSSHPYDLGVAENVNVIMGPNPLCWPFPTATKFLHSGLRFPTTYDTKLSQIDRDE